MKIEAMTSRERVMKAVNHEPVDRVPIDLGGNTATSISAFAYWNLREYLGLLRIILKLWIWCNSHPVSKRIF